MPCVRRAVSTRTGHVTGASVEIERNAPIAVTGASAAMLRLAPFCVRLHTLSVRAATSQGTSAKASTSSSSSATRSKSSADLFRTTLAQVPADLAPASQPRLGVQQGKSRHFKIKTSILKLKQVCRQVRGMDVTNAIRQLEVNPRKVAMEVRKCVAMARNSAVSQGAPSEGLVVSGYKIGRATPMKRIDIKAKGRFGVREKKWTNLELFVAPLAQLPGRKAEWRRRSALIDKRYAQWKSGELITAAASATTAASTATSE